MRPELSQRDLARALDVTPAVVCRDAKRGMPLTSVEAAKAWREAHLRARMRPGAPGAGATRPPGEGGGDYWASRARREQAEADTAELKLAEMRKQLVRVEEIEREYGRVASAIREQFTQLPSRVLPLLSAAQSVTEMERVLRNEIATALRVVAALEDYGSA